MRAVITVLSPNLRIRAEASSLSMTWLGGARYTVILSEEVKEGVLLIFQAVSSAKQLSLNAASSTACLVTRWVWLSIESSRLRRCCWAVRGCVHGTSSSRGTLGPG